MGFPHVRWSVDVTMAVRQSPISSSTWNASNAQGFQHQFAHRTNQKHRSMQSTKAISQTRLIVMDYRALKLTSLAKYKCQLSISNRQTMILISPRREPKAIVWRRPRWAQADNVLGAPDGTHDSPHSPNRRCRPHSGCTRNGKHYRTVWIGDRRTTQR